MRMRLLEEWNTFSKAIRLEEAPKVQRIEMRRAFYAGAASIMDTLAKAMSHEVEPTVEDLAVMTDFQRELLAFADDMRKGIA